jgi:ATPase involved in DNA replication initiation
MCKWSVLPKRALPVLCGPRVLVVQLAVAEGLGVPLVALSAGGRGDQKAAFARHVAMYLCHLVLAMSLTEIAAAFGRDRTTAAYAVRRIEEAREDFAFDATLARLEAAVLQLSQEGACYG